MEAEQGEVETLPQLEAFLTFVGGFHDGIIKELHWVNNDHVGTDLSMLPDRGANARILVQRQYLETQAVEIVLRSVQWIRLDTRAFIFGADLAQEHGFLKLILEDSEFVFERMSYRLMPDWMGETVRFGNPIV